MPDTKPTAPIGAKLYTTPVKAITPAYLPETSGPILHIDDMVVEALYNSARDGIDIIFDGYLVLSIPGPIQRAFRCTVSVAVIKAVTNNEVSYKFAIMLPSFRGNSELQTHTFTKYTGSDPNAIISKHGYGMVDSRGFQIPGEIAAVVAVDLGDKDSFAVVAKKGTGELTLSSYETNFTVNQVIGMVDYTTWGVSTDNALIDIEALKNFRVVNTDPALPEFDPNMPSGAMVEVPGLDLSVANIDLLFVDGVNMLDANGNVLFDKLDATGLITAGLTGDFQTELLAFSASKSTPTTVKIRLKANGEVIEPLIKDSPYIKLNADHSVEYIIVANPLPQE
jgi:hypothetical protein